MRSLFLVACITVGACQSSALADTADFQRAMNLAGEAKCDEAWDLIYPLVVAGNKDAAIVASSLIIHAGVVPPGSPSDALSLFRHAITLAMHGVNRENSETSKYAEGLLLLFSDESITGEIVSCLRGDVDFTSCESIAVTNGLIPDFQSYLGEMRRAAADNAEASCLSPYIWMR